jgi:hypothetical protein
MIKPISSDTLNGFIDNRVIDTKAVFITLEHLKDFISQVEKRHNDSTVFGFDATMVCDAIKICFVRFDFKPNDDQILAAGKDLAGKVLTQTSLIFVPVKTKNADRSQGWDSIELSKTDGLLSLCVCEPAVIDQNSTGVCPPNQGCRPGK